MSESSLPSADEVRSALQTEQDESQVRELLQRILSTDHPDDEKAFSDVLKALSKAVWENDNKNVDTIVDVLWLHSYMLPVPAENETLVRVLQTLLEGRKEHAANDADATHGLTRGLVSHLDAALLQKAGWVDEKELSKRTRLVNTQLYYKQHKFNLLAEESEGYAKFLSALQHLATKTTTTTTSQSFSSQDTTILYQLMGTFSLDPNRCLDLAIDILQTQQQQLAQQQEGATDAADAAAATTATNNMLFILKQLPLEHLPALLAFKLQGSAKDKQQLYAAMVWLVQQDVLSCSEMLEYLPGDRGLDDLLDEAYQAVDAYHRNKVRAMGRVRLGGGDANSNAAEQQKEAKLLQAATSSTQRLQESLAVQWILVFLKQDCFALVESVLNDQQWSQLCRIFPDTIGVAICDWVHKACVEPCYRLHIASVPWSKKKEQSDTVSSKVVSTTTLDDLVAKISKPLLNTSESGCILLRPILYTQLCRLLSFFLKQNANVSENVLDFIKTFLLPSLSLFPPNPSLSQEVWAVLEKLPYRTRYSFYRSWRGAGLERAALRTDKPLWLVESELQAGKDARYALKRLSKDTIRDMSRAVAKVCHSHPLVVFTTILNQIESYDNMIVVMVDALRFVTTLSLDVLSFCILSRLSGMAGGGGGVNRSRLKEDGLNVSQWLQSLESFAGAFYKRYPFIEFQGILSFLMSQLKDGHVMELGMLRTLLKTSAGWAFADYAPAASLSISQLEGRAGSTLLKRETMSFGVVEDINFRASNKIRRVLQSDDMGVSLLILLALVRNQIVFGSSTSEGRKPVKLIANGVDNCQVVMAILLDFLTDSPDGHSGDGKETAAAISVYARSLPPLAELHRVYGVDVASAWMLCRPLIRAAATSLESGEVEDRMEDGEEDPLNKFRSTEASHALYKGMLPEPTWSQISTELFEAFYTNALYDVFCPEEVYATEIARLDKEAERLAQQKSAPPPPPPPLQPGAPPTRSDEENLERVKRVAAMLSTDLSKQKKHVATMRASIASKEGTFFQSEDDLASSAAVFLSRCIYPRCMQGPDDAMYCARFISMLHEESTPGFSTLHLFDCLLVSMSRALFGLTEGEAANVSILLYEIWRIVSRWRYDESIYNEEVEGKPGSFMVKKSEDDDAKEEIVVVSYKDYEKLYNKWHAAIGAVALGCLKSSEYIHTRNCLIVLTRMVEVFPTRPGLANKLVKTLEPLQDESNTLADIRASAQAYSTQLLRARDDGVWKEESAATVRARQKKEQAAAAARQKQAEKQMEEIKRESEKITEEIGEWDGRRGDRRRLDARDSGPRRGGPTFEPPPMRGPPPRELMRDERWARDRGPGRMGEGGGRGLDDRWQRSGAGDRGEPSRGRGSKRSRPPSPAEEGETTRDDQRAMKRSRTEVEGGRDEGGRQDDGGGGRRRRGRR